MERPDIAVEKVDVSAYSIPTDAPEGDGTLRWDSTTLIVCEVHAGNQTGLGFTYGNQATAFVAHQLAARCLLHSSALDIPRIQANMLARVRNDGSRGIASMAISALDIALWDLKAKAFSRSIADLLGAASDSVPAYGSGGFTTYDSQQLTSQLSGWIADGVTSVKMKIGANPAADLDRVRVAREAIGPSAKLFVDANGAFHAREALAFADKFTEFDVTWFEEPVSSDDLAGLRRVRDHAPAAMEIAAGEYGYDSFYFRRMLEAEAVDVIQLDATRCKGFTGFLEAAAVASSFECPISAHCAPSLHMHVACAVPQFRHVEYFHDHARIEAMLFDGFMPPRGGKLMPDRTRPGIGLSFKHRDAEQFLVWRSK
ncbi:enolase C-terminal domain-like protein [Silvibacterium acidisoli]|uniref:enolase C-terminal domain-like protein n=1 Tax=Acidobacteriaceae bacterium ZG23-2 TaxID=2883246 RepID=UPI00406C1183